MTIFSVVIPTYNEEEGIADIVHRVLQTEPALRQIGIEQLELLVVDDGSKDRTREIAGTLPHIRLICHPTNKGYGAALKTGFSQATGDLIGFLDADGTYPPEKFPQLCQKALNGTDLVIGSRMSGAESQMPLTRRMGNFFFAHLLTLITRQKVTDRASGMRVFKRKILSKVYPLPDGLNLTPVMSTRAIHEGISLAEIPIPYSERVGHSKLSVVRDGSIFLHSILWTALTYNPARILGLVSLGGMGVALLAFLALILMRLQGITILDNRHVAALFAAAVSGVAGVSLFTLGVTFNYLVSLFRQRPIQSRPNSLFLNLDQHFGWLGLVSFLLGLGLGVVSGLLGINGWDITRLWLYLLGSSMSVLIGIQLMISWVIVRVLDELNQQR